MVSLMSVVTNVVVIGLTGNGKSALCNRLYGRQGFPESDGADSETTAIDCREGIFRVCGDKLPLKVIDTPGLGDRDNRDSDHIKQMIDKLRDIKKVHTFFLVINYQSPRIDVNTKRLFQLLPAMLPGKNFWRNVIVVFTKTYRPIASQSDIEKRTAEYQRKFQEEFKAELQTIQFAFVDSKDGKNDDNMGQFKNIFEFIRNITPFDTVGANVIEGGLEFDSFTVLSELRSRLWQEQKRCAEQERQKIEEQQQIEKEKLERIEQDLQRLQEESDRLKREERDREEELRRERQRTEELTALVERLRIEISRPQPQPQPQTYVAPVTYAALSPSYGNDAYRYSSGSIASTVYSGSNHGASGERILSNGGTFYRGVGRPRNTDYTASGQLRRH